MTFALTNALEALRVPNIEEFARLYPPVGNQIVDPEADAERAALSHEEVF